MARTSAATAREQGLVQPLRITEGITRGELTEILRGAAKDAERLVRLNMEAGNLAGVVRAKQLAAAVEGLGSLSQAMWERIGSLIRQGIHEEAALAGRQAIDREYLMGMPLKAIRQYEGTLLFDAFQSAEDIISRRTNGFKLADRIYRNGQATVFQVGQIIETGLAQQLSARELAKQTLAFFSPDVPGGTSYAAMRLARTEINNAHHDTTIRLTQDRPWVHGYKWNLSGSHPKNDVCNEYAEEDHDDLGAGVFAKDDAPSKPHPQCLCYLEVVQQSRDEFIESLTSGSYSSYMDEIGVTN